MGYDIRFYLVSFYGFFYYKFQIIIYYGEVCLRIFWCKIKKMWSLYVDIFIVLIGFKIKDCWGKGVEIFV